MAIDMPFNKHQQNNVNIDIKGVTIFETSHCRTLEQFAGGFCVAVVVGIMLGLFRPQSILLFGVFIWTPGEILQVKTKRRCAIPVKTR
jgi:hypothetical protein